MGGISVKTKVVSLAILPVVMITLIIMLIVRMQLQELGEQEVDRARAAMMAEKKQVLKDYVNMALTSVQELYRSTSLTTEQAQAEAKKILTNLTYGNDNYIFVFDYDGKTLAHRLKPSLLGKSLLGSQDSQGRYYIRELIDQARNGGGFVEYVWSLPSGGEGPKLSYAAGLPQWNWAIGTGFMIDDIDKRVAELRAEMGQRIRATLMTIAGVALVLVAIIATLALWLAGRIVTPLSDTAAAMRDIAEGEGDLTRRLNTLNADEIGAVTDGFNTFALKIHQLVKEVKGGIIELSGATQNMQGVVQTTHDEAQQQHNETQAVATAVHEMAAAVHQVAGSASNAAEAANSADARAVEGAQLVEGTIRNIGELAEEVNSAGAVIQQLDTHTDNISGVINVIKDIADQTNLLALNAAIEAARAGEQGRGFSVVADEVRTLATRTQSSTDEIQQMIDALLAGVAEAVSVIERSKQKAGQTIQQAEQAGLALSEITGAVSTITDMNTQIASAAEQQTAVAEEISKSVQAIADIAERSAGQADSLAATTDGMVELERRLNTLIAQFKV